MSCIGIITLLLVCFGLFVPPVLCQGNQSSIGGMVFDPQRNPVTEVPVELMTDFNSVIRRVKTDGSGRFLFRSLASGRYVVRVLPLGTNFEEQTQDVEIGGVGRAGQISESAQVDFQLRLRRRSSDLNEVKGVVFAQDVPEQARRLYETAISDLDSVRLEAGTAGLENAVKLFPTFYLALAKLGLVYVGQQKFDSAKDAFSKAVAVNERSFGGWYGLSYASYALNQPAESVAAGQKALAIDKNSVNALFILGLSQRRLKMYVEAEKSLVQAKKLDKGKTPDINWNLALLYAHNLKRYNDAAAELEAYLKINPDAPNKEAVTKLIKQFRETPPK